MDSPGKRLASFRKSLQLSQRAFATKIGVSGGLIGQIEADLVPPSRSFLERISEVYHVSADWLLHGVGQIKHSLGTQADQSDTKTVLSKADSETFDMSSGQQPVDQLLLMICGSAVSQVYAGLGLSLTREEHYRQGIWFMNELLNRMKDPEDGDEMEALMPEIRALLSAKLADDRTKD